MITDEMLMQAELDWQRKVAPKYAKGTLVEYMPKDTVETGKITDTRGMDSFKTAEVRINRKWYKIFQGFYQAVRLVD